MMNAGLLLNIYDIDNRYQYYVCSNFVYMLRDLSHMISGCACLRGYVCVRVCVYIYIYIYIYMCIYVYIYMYIPMYALINLETEQHKSEFC